MEFFVVGLFLFFSTLLLSGTVRCSRLILYCPSPSISHFSKEPWFLLLENGSRRQNLGARCTHYYQMFLISPLSL